MINIKRDMRDIWKNGMFYRGGFGPPFDAYITLRLKLRVKPFSSLLNFSSNIFVERADRSLQYNTYREIFYSIFFPNI